MEGSLVCYGEPTTTPLAGHECNFKRDRTYPATSRLYLYLMNNMFDCNIAADQQGPVSFNWSLRSHAGDWKTGGADRFGRSVQQPLIAWRADGENAGTLPASGSFHERGRAERDVQRHQTRRGERTRLHHSPQRNHWQGNHRHGVFADAAADRIGQRNVSGGKRPGRPSQGQHLQSHASPNSASKPSA